MSMGSSEVVQALADRRRAGEPFAEAWPEVIGRLCPRQRELFRTETFEAAYRDAYERRPPQPRHRFTLGAIEETPGPMREHSTLIA